MMIVFSRDSYIRTIRTSSPCICCGSRSWFKFYFLLFRGMIMYDNEFETKENKI